MKRRLLTLALALTLLCSACAVRQGSGQAGPPPEGQVSVYFLTDPDQPGGDGSVPAREFRVLPEDTGGVEGLIRLLLNGPESLTLRSPFPQGTALRAWRLEEGLVTIDLSEAYGGLSGVGLTLADACIVLTLCQLEEVDRVYLTVEGRPRPFRDQVMEPEQFCWSWSR